MIKQQRPYKYLIAILVTGLILAAQIGYLYAAIYKADGEPVVITLRAITGLQFDLPRFAVKPGAQVKIVLVNSDDMPHNLLITKPGGRQEVVDAALKLADKGPELNYLPPISQVLWSIPVLSPGESKSITFKVPETPGIYPYVCTYPGHGFVMYGAMYVTAEALPPLQHDMNIPSNRREDSKSTVDHTGHRVAEPSHPYTETPPYLYRVFINDSGPATVAVRLPGNLSYFWDAGICRLRFATEGDFLDMKELWAGHRQAVAKNLGAVFFRDKTVFPLRTGKIDNVPHTKFKGYRLIDRYPEFQYELGDLDVYELIKEKPDGTGLERTLRIPQADQPVWFVFSPDDGVEYQFSAGQRSNGLIELTAAQAKQFTIIMTKRKEL